MRRFGVRIFAAVMEKVEMAVLKSEEECLEAFRYPLAQQGFKVDVEIAPDLPDVPLDAAAIKQALANLVDNAIKYSGERRRLRVSARLAGQGYRFVGATRGAGRRREDHGREG